MVIAFSIIAVVAIGATIRALRTDGYRRIPNAPSARDKDELRWQ